MASMVTVAPWELEFGKQSRQGFHLVAFLQTDFVPDAQARFAGPGAQDVQGAFARGGVLGSTADFAINGDVFALQIADPQLHDFQQCVGAQGEEDIAEDIVRGSAVAQRDELAQPKRAESERSGPCR
jgi:hypothetical protein